MDYKKKILFFCSFPPPNTGQTIATKLLYDSIRPGYITDKISIVDKNRHNRPSGSFSIRVVFNLLAKYCQLVGKFIGNKYDVVYVVYASTKFALLRDVICTCIIKTFSNAKLIAHLHSGNYGDNFKGAFFSSLLKYQLNRVDKLVFLSPSLNHIKGIIAEDKVVYLPNMIQYEVISTPTEVADKIAKRVNADAINVVFISNMIAEKGYHDLINALKTIWAQGKTNYKLHLVGAWKSDEARAEVEQVLKNELSAGLAQIYGAVYNRAHIKGMFLMADVFVLPTYYPIEGQPLSIIEAFCAGTPVISTCHAAIPDMVADGINGFLVQPHSPNTIAEKLLLLTDTNTWANMAKAARTTYEQKYSSEIILPQVQLLFK